MMFFKAVSVRARDCLMRVKPLKNAVAVTAMSIDPLHRSRATPFEPEGLMLIDVRFILSEHFSMMPLSTPSSSVAQLSIDAGGPLPPIVGVESIGAVASIGGSPDPIVVNDGAKLPSISKSMLRSVKI